MPSQLFKIRRLIVNSYEYWTPAGWTKLQIDAFAFPNYSAAKNSLEQIKSDHYRARPVDEKIIYHSVIPA